MQGIRHPTADILCKDSGGGGEGGKHLFVMILLRAEKGEKMPDGI